MEDRELIALLRAAPAEGLREAIRQYGGLLKTVVGRILPGCPQDVEECVADTYVNAWKTMDRLDADSSLKAYLVCIARNIAINRYHQLRRQSHTSLEDMELAGGEDVELVVMGDETMSQLQALIVDMSEPDREIVIRKYFLFESLREIGGRLGLTEEQVKKRLYRSRQRLKTALEERGITYEAG